MIEEEIFNTYTSDLQRYVMEVIDEIGLQDLVQEYTFEEEYLRVKLENGNHVLSLCLYRNFVSCVYELQIDDRGVTGITDAHKIICKKEEIFDLLKYFKSVNKPSKEDD